MKATVTVFLTETHVTRFQGEDSEGDTIIFDNPQGLNYDDAIAAVPTVVGSIGGVVTESYSEENEFGDPISCFFVDIPNDRD